MARLHCGIESITEYQVAALLLKNLNNLSLPNTRTYYEVDVVAHMMFRLKACALDPCPNSAAVSTNEKGAGRLQSCNRFRIYIDPAAALQMFGHFISVGAF
jgi:hypothetical protein